LEEINDKTKIGLVVEGLNRNLKSRIAKKNMVRDRLKLRPQWILYFSILILLIIIVLVFMFLHNAPVQ